MWLSNDPAPTGLWRLLHAEHQRSGLWPLLLDSYTYDASRPWDDGEIWPNAMSSPAQHDAEPLLAGWWASYTEVDDEDDELSPDQRLAVTAPYGQQWPGSAAPAQQQMAPDRHADHCAEQLLQAQPTVRLGLVAADSGSDALTVAGWQGAVNYVNDTAKLSAVLHTWEDRFGARVIGVGFAELYVSVAAPPSGTAEALHVAAEHFAFCPDNVWQGPSPCTLAAYAERLIGAPTWVFWWD
ncbi:DUF4253 domain-containing protein [Micromonospora sp. CPCC 206061]|uniref:DUF4253 domain-containing protein n=1 Tax=Micromonospora sp. CPCC 206061 TaxID=3122410 RepID=UPI002FF14B14